MKSLFIWSIRIVPCAILLLTACQNQQSTTEQEQTTVITNSNFLNSSIATPAKASISQSVNHQENRQNSNITSVKKAILSQKNQSISKLNQLVQDSLGNITTINDSLVNVEKIASIPENLTKSYLTFDYLAFENPTSTQLFEIFADKDTVLVGNEGTQLSIKANSFTTPEGEFSQGLVQLKLQEFYQFNDMLLANLNTTTKGKLLETGGMFYIEATTNGQPLSLKNNTTISVVVPNEKPKSGMQVYYSNNEQKGKDWSLLAQTSSNDTIKTIKLPLKQYICHKKFEEEIIIGAGKKKIKQNVLLNSEEIVYPFIINKQNRAKFDTIKIVIDVNSKGHITKQKVINFQKSTNLSGKKLKVFCEKRGFLSRRRFYNIVMYNSKNIFVTSKFTNNDLLKYLANNPISTKNRRIVLTLTTYTTNFDRYIQPQNIGEIPNAYLFDIQKLGWVNIDKLYKENRKPVDFVIKADEYTDVKIIFPALNAIRTWEESTSTEKRITNMPAQADVKIIAIRTINGKPSLAYKNTYISDKIAVLPAFQQFETVKDLQEAIQKIIN